MASWLPGVKRQDFGTDGGSWTRQPAIICLHSTEGTSWPGYSGGSEAPHFTVDPTTGEVRQHISMEHAARALANPSGGVETNRGGAIQIEIIGTCDPDHRGDAGWTYLPDLDDWGAVADLVAQIGDACGIPLSTSVDFGAYPSPAYGSGPPRLSSSEWGSYRGVLGHQHVPENDHGDPGNIDITAILRGGTAVAFDDQEETQIRANVRAAPITLRDGTTDTLEAQIGYLVAIGAETQRRVDALADQVAALAGGAGPTQQPPDPEGPPGPT